MGTATLKASLKFFFPKFTYGEFIFRGQFIEIVAKIEQQHIGFINIIGRGIKIASRCGNSLLVCAHIAKVNVLP